MSDPKSQKPATPDSLTKSGKGASIELSENELNTVSGGIRKDSMTSANKQTEGVKGLL
jgi:bacteriocin-like protein